MFTLGQQLRLLATAVFAALLVAAAQGQEPEARNPSPLFQSFFSVRGSDNLVDPSEPIDLNSTAFNVFFDSVEVGLDPAWIGFEVTKQHVLFADPRENTWRTGWRVEGSTEDWWLSGGDEVRGGWKVSADETRAISDGWLRDVVRDTRWSAYTTTGLRGMRLRDEFFFHATGGILDNTGVETTIDHDVIGPQLGLGAVAEYAMFRFEATLLGLVGHGRFEANQRSSFGATTVPGALNRPASVLATVTEAPAVSGEHVAWHGEARLTASCQLTQRLRFDATWRGVTMGPIRSAAEATRFSLPDFGIDPQEGRRADFDQWFLGLTYTR